MMFFSNVFWVVPLLTWVATEDDLTGGVSPKNKLKIVDLFKAPSCSMETQQDDNIHWHYKGMLLNGHVFDEGNFNARLGHHDVITGVDKGMRGLCVGDKRRMTMHYDWAYGESGIAGTIPPKSNLIFEVELLSIERPGVGKVTKDDIINRGGDNKENAEEYTGGVSKENKLKINRTYEVESTHCKLKTELNDTVTYIFDGYLSNGVSFQYGNFTSTIGHDEVIIGIDKGILDMCVGDERELIIHSDWGYGDEGYDGWNIPPYETLIYDIQLYRIEKPDGRTADIAEIIDFIPPLKHNQHVHNDSGKLKIEETYKSGKCELISQKDDTIHWKYKGILADGTVFDEGRYQTTLGQRNVIEGVEKGMLNMCVGDTRKLTVHPDWGYGDKGTEGVPPKATLIFENELLQIERPNGKTATHYPIDPETGLPDGQLLKIDIIHSVDDCTIRSQKDDTIHWHYKGTLVDGTEFHSGDFVATLGHDQIITGVDKGMRGMCVGEKRHLTIDPEWGYGDEGREGSIPPKATLFFDVEMTKIERPKSEL